MDLRKTHTTILSHGDPEQKRAEILEYFHDTFDIDEKLYDTLRYDDTFYLRADRLRHPLIFYFGHTATFYINKLTIARVIDSRINPALRIHVCRGGGRDVVGRPERSPLRLADPPARSRSTAIRPAS